MKREKAFWAERCTQSGVLENVVGGGKKKGVGLNEEEIGAR